MALWTRVVLRKPQGTLLKRKTATKRVKQAQSQCKVAKANARPQFGYFSRSPSESELPVRFLEAITMTATQIITAMTPPTISLPIMTPHWLIRQHQRARAVTIPTRL